MENVNLKRDGKKLLIEIDLSKEVGPSATGKTIIIGTTRGNAQIPDFVGGFVGINCFKYPDGKKGKSK